MTRALALLVAFASACSGHGPQQVGAQPSWRHGTTAGTEAPKVVAPVTFAPSSEAAVHYNERITAPPHTPLGDAALAATREAAGKAGMPAPVADARLFKACSELAEIVPEEGIVGYSLVEFALQRNGIIEPSPHLLVVWGDVDAADQIVEQIKPRLAEILADGANARVGIGWAKRAADGTGAIVFALQGSGVSTNPIPRALPAGGAVTVDAVVDAHYKEPEVFVTRESGATERLALETGHSGGFKTKVECGKHIGRQQVEITASDQQGSTVLANFPVWCGAEPPASMTIAATHDDDTVVAADEAEKRLLALMNRDRGAANLPSLVWDDRVADVARKHSEEMRRTKIVAHISPTTGSAADRVKAANIKTAVVLENVARAYGVGEAHEGLMNSPGHRANLMSAAATHVGIGVVYGDDVSGRREMFVTQVFIRVPPKIDPAQAAELVRSRIEKVRRIGVSAVLQSTAQQLADGLAAGKSRDTLWPRARKQLDALGNQYARVGSVITAVAELDTVDGKELVGEYLPDDIGVGIAQGTHPEIGENAVWIVVLMAERNPPASRPPPPSAGPR
ncbi:MAG: CAP domain-containing protein [Deltaproteobacteria bacterium]|nr:CAP domain-containing protein [Deltaproteobacteria bacterium]